MHSASMVAHTSSAEAFRLSTLGWDFAADLPLDHAPNAVVERVKVR